MSEVMKIINRKEENAEFTNFIDVVHPKDSMHRVFRNVGLKLNADIHLFKNGDGEECAGIWSGEEEWGWIPVRQLDDMVNYWNEEGYKTFKKQEPAS